MHPAFHLEPITNPLVSYSLGTILASPSYQISATPSALDKTSEVDKGLFIPICLSRDPKLVIEFEALCKKLIYAALSFWNIISNQEFSIHSHIVNRIELKVG